MKAVRRRGTSSTRLSGQSSPLNSRSWSLQRIESDVASITARVQHADYGGVPGWSDAVDNPAAVLMALLFLLHSCGSVEAQNDLQRSEVGSHHHHLHWVSADAAP